MIVDIQHGRDGEHTIWIFDKLGHPDRIGTTPYVAGSTYKLSTRMLQSRTYDIICTRLCGTTLIRNV